MLKDSIKIGCDYCECSLRPIFLNYVRKSNLMNTKSELKLISSLPPSVNHYLAPRIYYDKRTKQPRVMMYETSEAKKYKRTFTSYAKAEAMKQGWEKPENRYQQIYYDCIYYFDRIDDDPNNYEKVPIDSLTNTGNIWVDDNIVMNRTIRTYYDTKNPRIEITIHLVEYVGIFDTVVQAGQFEDKCMSCSRYREGKCSILTKAFEARIQPEIIKINDEYICEKFKEAKVKKGK